MKFIYQFFTNYIKYPNDSINVKQPSESVKPYVKPSGLQYNPINKFKFNNNINNNDIKIITNIIDNIDKNLKFPYLIHTIILYKRFYNILKTKYNRSKIFLIFLILSIKILDDCDISTHLFICDFGCHIDILTIERDVCELCDYKFFISNNEYLSYNHMKSEYLNIIYILYENEET